MRSRVSRKMLCVAPAIAFASFCHARCAAEDHFVVVGGGYSPTGNQVSIESNVLFFQRTLKTLQPDGLAPSVFFADGDAPERDLQFVDEKVKKACPPAQRIMTEILGDRDSVGLCYRDHQVPDIAGASEASDIRGKLRALGRELKSGDRLFIYATGHGAEAYGNYDYDYKAKEWVEKDREDGEEADYNHYDTSLYLWNSESVLASQFTRWLDRLPEDVPVVLVMVQCYSGGFAHSIFHRNDAEMGLTPALRCGFFSQVHDRPAAGCTPEMREEDYREYSTYFWAALGGKTRPGEEIDRPDYDGDGQTSLAEAHAYVVIEAETIDIPVRTSEELLRRYSRLGGTPANDRDEKGDGDGALGGLLGLLAGKDAKAPVDQELIAATGPISELLAHARPDYRAMLEQLPQKAGLEQPLTVDAVRLALKKAEYDLGLARLELGNAAEAQATSLADLKADVFELWPELSDGYSPTAAELTGERGDEFVSQVEELASYDAFERAAVRAEEAAEKLAAAERAEARLQRIVRAAETVALAANLKKSAPEEIVARYEAMVALEEQTVD